MLEGCTPRQHLVKRHSQAVHVRTTVVGFVQETLRSHVGGGADAVAVERQLLVDFGIADQFGDPEIEHFDDLFAFPRLMQEDVLRFDVAMDDAEFVSGRQDLAKWTQDLETTIRGNLPELAQLFIQGMAFEQLHDEKNHAVFVARKIEHADRVRMVEARERNPLLLETGKGDAVAAHRRTQNLDRDLPLQLEVGGAVDGPEVAATDERFDPVFTFDHGPWQEAVARAELLPGAPPQLRGDPGQGDGKVERFGDVVVGAEAEGVDHVFTLVLGRGHDHRQLMFVVTFPQGFEHLEAGEARHHHVEKDQIGHLAFENFERLFTRPCGYDVVAGMAEHVEAKLQIHLVVFDHEDAALARIASAIPVGAAVRSVPGFTRGIVGLRPHTLSPGA